MSKLIIVVAYSTASLEAHSHLLTEHGHEVIPMLGNSDALRHRSQFEHAAMVVLGESEDEGTRQKFAQWMKQNFPALKLIALGIGVVGADVIAHADTLIAVVQAG